MIFEVVTLAEVKAYLKVSSIADDVTLEMIRVGCIGTAEQATNRTLNEREITVSAPLCLSQRLAPAPFFVDGIVTVKMLTETGTADIPSSAWIAEPVHQQCQLTLLAVTEQPNQHIRDPLQVTLNAGYKTVGDVPADIRLAILDLCAVEFSRRGGCDCGAGVEEAALKQLRKHRISRVF
ncbi:hypothetical protein [Pseudomonas arsenicoxydans]|uniref:Phage gp6-like head-tail connector protein n=1 Tax=Pseudomonas arsenicoxydans TaxID=702115 RepID=A0A502HNI3_9PSED|nr:hypothetical protein [Pseudomonas arsenicoxydans]TPG76317.1 hypothetical protein EAH78_18310 [Pseudomonas arsenicoxydans]